MEDQSDMWSEFWWWCGGWGVRYSNAILLVLSSYIIRLEWNQGAVMSTNKKEVQDNKF